MSAEENGVVGSRTPDLEGPLGSSEFGYAELSKYRRRTPNLFIVSNVTYEGTHSRLMNDRRNLEC